MLLNILIYKISSVNLILKYNWDSAYSENNWINPDCQREKTKWNLKTDAIMKYLLKRGLANVAILLTSSWEIPAW